MNAKVMQEGFTKWFLGQPGLRTANPYLIESLCNHVVTGRALTEFELTADFGVTNTLIKFGEWLYHESFVKSKIYLVSKYSKVCNQKDIVLQASWGCHLREIKGALFLCESAKDKYEMLKPEDEERTVRLLSFTNSVFYAAPGVVDAFLQLVDN
jgi:hypothetical protein